MSVPKPFVPTAAASSAATTAMSFLCVPFLDMDAARSSAGRGAATAGSNTLNAPSRPSNSSECGKPTSRASSSGERLAERNKPACSSHSSRTVPPGPTREELRFEFVIRPASSARSSSAAATNEIPSLGSSIRSMPTTDLCPSPVVVSSDLPCPRLSALAADASAPTTPPLDPESRDGSTGALVHARQCAKPSTAARHLATDRNATAAAFVSILSPPFFPSSPSTAGA
mmetsp:Transcript_13667/g.37416  ORF Transcript_13667/g.37416 Transcript_13667/m.37416 type:complete len:228 (-) Transcript_13667:158-841(-)